MSRSLTARRSPPSRENRDAATARSTRASWPTVFVFGLGLALLVQGLGGAAAKLASGRTDDLAHTALHIASGLAGLIAAGRHSDRAARTFAGAFGVFYLALAALGWFGSAPSAWLHLAVADNVFHTIVGAMTIGVAIWPLRPASGVGVEP